jgi:microcystin-dependent protein
MAYQIQFTDSTNPAKIPLVVEDGSLNTTTDLAFVGKNYSGYAPVIAKDFLHLLENFASPTAPSTPVQGELWYDTGNKILMLYDGTNWVEAGSLKKGNTAPAVASSNIGDLWVNTTTQQLYLFGGSSWVLVGPQYTTGNTTGPIVETIDDINNVTHNVISMYANGYRIAIISKETFNPKSSISGFSSINEGINLSTVDASNSLTGATVVQATMQTATIGTTSSSFTVTSAIGVSRGATFSAPSNSSNITSLTVTAVNGNTVTFSPSVVFTPNFVSGTSLTFTNLAASVTRFWGTAQSADSLLINNTAVSSSNFLRSDVSSTTNYPLNIKNASGISVGNNLDFNLGINGTSIAFTGNVTGNSFDFITNNKTMLHIDATGNVGIGANNTNPTTVLSVAGVITSGVAGTAGGLVVTDGTTNNSTVLSANTTLGITTSLALTSSANITTSGKILISGNASGGPVIQPAADQTVPIYDIGSPTRPFRNIYASTFNGVFNGSFAGTVSGSVIGTAAALTNSTLFKLGGTVGNVQSDFISVPDPVSGIAGTLFNGISANGQAVLTVTADTPLITNKPAATDSSPSDQLLVLQTTVNSSVLKSMTKSVFLSHVSQVPVGSILPFAGTGSTVPAGYLLCDGSEISQDTYRLLYNVIGSSYNLGTPMGKNTFCLPDLRGRFALGRDNMDNLTDGINGSSVNSYTQATDVNGNLVYTGGVLSGSAGAKRITSTTADTVGGSGGQQNAVLDVTELPTYAATGATQYFSAATSSSASNNANPGKAVPIVNPYLTINYIIFTGNI